MRFLLALNQWSLTPLIFAAATLARVLMLFPDPWPKRKHHKRRLSTPAFIATLAAKIMEDGLLHLATDWQDYAEEMRETIATNGCFEAVGDGTRPRWRSATRFEMRGCKAGRKAINLLYRRKSMGSDSIDRG